MNHAISLRDVTTAVYRSLIGCRCFTKAGLAADTAAVQTANTIAFDINGHAGSKAATSGITLGGDVLPISSYRWYLVCVDTAGDMFAYPSADNTPDLAVIPDNMAPVGAVKIVTDATHTFTPGTTELAADGITDTYYDLSCVPTAGVPA